jgi:hypothetical protein
MSDPLDLFDPLAALESMLEKGAASDPHQPTEGWGDSVDIPLDLDTLAARLPGETSRALIVRAAAVARTASGHLLPAQPVRLASPDLAPAPPLPYPFDGSDPLNDSAIVRLVLPASSALTANQRTAAALLLVRESERHHGAPLSLADALNLWWKAARRLIDIPAALKRPGVSVSTLRLLCLRPAAHDFADAKGLSLSARGHAFEAAGIPMPTDKKGKPKNDGGGSSVVF